MMKISENLEVYEYEDGVTFFHDCDFATSSVSYEELIKLSKWINEVLQRRGR